MSEEITERQQLIAEEAIALQREGSEILKKVESLMAQVESKFSCARAIFNILKVEIPSMRQQPGPPLILIPEEVGEEKGAEKETAVSFAAGSRPMRKP
jgi:hypothetical protein